MKQLKNKKLLWLLAASALVLVGCIGGGVWYLNGHSGEAVKVYEFNLVGMDTYWGDEKSCNGSVSTDGLQTVPLSSTQEVTEILVAEGDLVKKGDLLMTYDTTLTELDLERKRLAVEKAQLSIDIAKAELNDINALKPAGEITYNDPTYEPLRVSYMLAEGEEYAEYDGSCAEKGIICWMQHGTAMTEDIVQEICAIAEERQGESFNGTVYAIVKQTYNDNLYGTVTCFQGICFPGCMEYMTFFEGSRTGDYMTFTGEEYDFSGSYGYSQSEINRMRKDKQKEIITLNQELSKAKSEYKLAQLEASNGQVVAKLDGKVISVLSVEDAKEKKQPIIKISGGGGYSIRGSISELERSDLTVGSTVTVNDWTNGGCFEGTVVSIGDFPTSETGSSGSGNPNASRYPFTVFVDETADLISGTYVSLSYTLDSDSTSLYVQTPFVRKDDSGSYCYVQGANGRLEKRQVTTGKTLWGAYLEVTGGISSSDLLAFPYGDNVKDGAKTEKGDLSALYG